MKLRKKLLALAALLQFIFPVGSRAQNGSARAVVPVRIAGVDLNFSPMKNQLLTIDGKALPEARGFSHSNAIAFDLRDILKKEDSKPYVARFYTGARGEKPQWETPKIVRSLAQHEIDSLIQLAPMAVRVAESGEAGQAGQGTLYAVFDPPRQSFFVKDLIKNGGYGKFHHLLRSLAEALHNSNWDVGLKPGHALIDLDGPEPRARLMRAVRDDREGDSGQALGKAYDQRLDRLAAWPGIYKDLVNIKGNFPDLKETAFANSPGQVARLVTHAIQVGQALWVYDDWSKGKSKPRGKAKIAPSKESFDHDFLLDGYFKAHVYTIGGNLPKETEMFRLEHTPWASVTEPPGSGPVVLRPVATAKASEKSGKSPAKTVSKKTIEKRQKQLAEQQKTGTIKTNQVFKFPQDDPMKVMDIIQRLYAAGAEVRIFYKAGRKVTERAKKEAAPAIKAGKRPDQFTGKITSIAKSSDNPPEYSFNILTDERVGLDKDGNPIFLTRKLNPWVGHVRKIKVLESRPEK